MGLLFERAVNGRKPPLCFFRIHVNEARNMGL